MLGYKIQVGNLYSRLASRLPVPGLRSLGVAGFERLRTRCRSRTLSCTTIFPCARTCSRPSFGLAAWRFVPYRA